MTFALGKQIKRGQQKAFGSTFPTRGRGVMGTSGPRDLGMGLVGSELLLAREAALILGSLKVFCQPKRIS